MPIAAVPVVSMLASRMQFAAKNTVLFCGLASMVEAWVGKHGICWSWES